MSTEVAPISLTMEYVGEHPTAATLNAGKLAAIKDYVETKGVPVNALSKMAKFGVAVDGWIERNQLGATAIQCWTAMEEFFGIVPCTLMSMMSNNLMPSACEVDVMGALAMNMLVQASTLPSALVDWNNNYGDDPDKAVIFHCSNLPKDIFKKENVSMQFQEIIAGTVGAENTYGTIYGRVAKNPFTYLRVSTDDTAGVMKAYVGEGQLTDDPLLTFGGYGVVQVMDFPRLLRHICENGYEHHVSVNPSHTGLALNEAMTKYLGWRVYRHS